jgi:hypothetical protein
MNDRWALASGLSPGMPARTITESRRVVPRPDADAPSVLLALSHRRSPTTLILPPCSAARICLSACTAVCSPRALRCSSRCPTSPGRCPRRTRPCSRPSSSGCASARQQRASQSAWAQHAHRVHQPPVERRAMSEGSVPCCCRRTHQLATRPPWGMGSGDRRPEGVNRVRRVRCSRAAWRRAAAAPW